MNQPNLSTDSQLAQINPDEKKDFVEIVLNGDKGEYISEPRPLSSRLRQSLKQ